MYFIFLFLNFFVLLQLDLHLCMLEIHPFRKGLKKFNRFRLLRLKTALNSVKPGLTMWFNPHYFLTCTAWLWLLS